jgi:hypothetical protein
LVWKDDKSARFQSAQATASEDYSGWQLPFLPSDLSAIVEKELRYVLRNAQVRMMALMPLIIIIIRLVNRQRFGTAGRGFSTGFSTYGSGLLLIGGMVYVFLILAGLSSNLFAFEEGGMRTFILSPVDRRKILLGKNLVLTVDRARVCYRVADSQHDYFSRHHPR